jgi:DNA-binding CsgD family transcriptional regulator
MSLNNPRLNNQLSSPLPLNYAAQNLTRLQTDLVSTARMWAVDEVGAAMAHQLNEPLTALLLYLHELKQEIEQSTDVEAVPNSRRDMVERALHETERLCEIMDRMGNGFEGPAEADVAVARGRESINWWARSGNAKGGASSLSAATPSGQQLLTPREREVLALITSGTSNKEGGHLLGISTRTFEVHRAHIMAKLGARNAADLVRVALSEG